jgi:hypothetical protein
MKNEDYLSAPVSIEYTTYGTTNILPLDQDPKMECPNQPLIVKKKNSYQLQYELEDAKQSLEVALEDIAEIQVQLQTLVEECERLIGIGPQQNTLPRFEKAVQSAREFINNYE